MAKQNGDWAANQKFVLAAIESSARNIRTLYERTDEMAKSQSKMVGVSIGINIVVGIVVVLAVAYFKGRAG